MIPIEQLLPWIAAGATVVIVIDAWVIRRRLRRDVAYWAQSYRALAEQLDATRLKWLTRQEIGFFVIWDVSIAQLLTLARLHGEGTTIYPYGDRDWWITQASQLHLIYKGRETNVSGRDTH